MWWRWNCKAGSPQRPPILEMMKLVRSYIQAWHHCRKNCILLNCTTSFSSNKVRDASRISQFFLVSGTCINRVDISDAYCLYTKRLKWESLLYSTRNSGWSKGEIHLIGPLFLVTRNCRPSGHIRFLLLVSNKVQAWRPPNPDIPISNGKKVLWLESFFPYNTIEKRNVIACFFRLLLWAWREILSINFVGTQGWLNVCG